MKTLVTILLLTASALSTFAQVIVDGENINDLPITYAQLIGYNRAGFTGTRIWIDYGQPKFSSSFLVTQKIGGRTGVPIKFNTVIDALNFVTDNGWEPVSMTVTADKEGDTERFIYLLRRRGR